MGLGKDYGAGSNLVYSRLVVMVGLLVVWYTGKSQLVWGRQPRQLL